MAKRIGIISGKGGVGKTTLAVNLSTVFHALGENTLLVDANLTNPHVGLSLGSGHYQRTVYDALAGTADHAQTISLHESGLKIAPGDAHGRVKGADMARLAGYNSMADVVVYDAPPAAHEHVLETADQFLIVTNSQPTALADAQRLINTLQERQKTITGVVVNKNAEHPRGIEVVERVLGVPVVATIPFDNRFETATAKRAPFVQLYPNRKASKAIAELAARILCRPL
jgi:MinD-like ATPase involved in chromosome partitioning or flagellar assembly